MSKTKLIYLVPIVFGFITLLSGFLPGNLPPALSEYRNIQDVRTFDFPLSLLFRTAFFFSWLLTYISIYRGNRKYIYLCIFSFVGFIASKLLFGPIVTTAATGILEQLTIFSVGVALGVAYRNGDT